MGAWSTGIFDDDTALDIKTEYFDLLAYFSDEAAEKKVIEDFKELIDSDEESTLWYALALAEWKKGRLSEYVKQQALECIDRRQDLDIWKEAGEKPYVKRIEVLEELKNRLLAEQPIRKKISRPTPIRSPWQEGELLVHKITNTNLSVEKSIGKYVLLRVCKIEKVPVADYIDEYAESIYLALYNWCGDEIPDASIVNRLHFIPMLPYTYKNSGYYYLYLHRPTKFELKKINLISLGIGAFENSFGIECRPNTSTQEVDLSFDFALDRALSFAGLV